MSTKPARTQELSPAMEAAMWTFVRSALMKRAKVGCYTINKTGISSLRALVRRGLLAGTHEAPGWGAFGQHITPKGWQWVREQVELAHEEASLDERQARDESDQRMRWYRRHDRCDHGHDISVVIECDHGHALDMESDAQHQQYRDWVDRHGGPTGLFHQQRNMVDIDHVDAIQERLEQARRIENYTESDEYHAAVAAARYAGLLPAATN